MNEKVMEAFRRVSQAAFASVGGACQNDLILLGTEVGLTEEELQKNFPVLYEKGEESEPETQTFLPA